MPHRPEARGRERMAVAAGQVRIALGLLGILWAQLSSVGAPYRNAFIAYLAISVLFQWVIQRLRRSVSRAFVMGVVDVLFLSFVVQRLGSVTSVVPLVYVAVPVLFATTTTRRRLSISLASLGVGLYIVMVGCELLGLLPYAPAVAGTMKPELVQVVASVMLVAGCSVGTAVMTSHLIRALENANARLSDLSEHDDLTGLYNRRHVMRRLEDELARLARRPGALTVAMIDLDGFKRVNDEVGHDAGDAVLRAVATALLAATRRQDVVARYGGDEFVILLPNTEHEGARIVGARILDQARDAATSVCPSIPVSASIGTTSAQPGDDPTTILRRVDEQLYAAKRAGGDRIYTG